MLVFFKNILVVSVKLIDMSQQNCFNVKAIKTFSNATILKCVVCYFAFCSVIGDLFDLYLFVTLKISGALSLQCKTIKKLLKVYFCILFFITILHWETTHISQLWFFNVLYSAKKLIQQIYVFLHVNEINSKKNNNEPKYAKWSRVALLILSMLYPRVKIKNKLWEWNCHSWGVVVVSDTNSEKSKEINKETADILAREATPECNTSPEICVFCIH